MIIVHTCEAEHIMNIDDVNMRAFADVLKSKYISDIDVRKLRQIRVT